MELRIEPNLTSYLSRAAGPWQQQLATAFWLLLLGPGLPASLPPRPPLTDKSAIGASWWEPWTKGKVRFSGCLEGSGMRDHSFAGSKRPLFAFSGEKSFSIPKWQAEIHHNNHTMKIDDHESRAASGPGAIDEDGSCSEGAAELIHCTYKHRKKSKENGLSIVNSVES